MQKLLIAGWAIFVTSCARNTQLQIDTCTQILCEPIYGRATDWDNISDDLARNIYRHNKLCAEYALKK